MFESAGKFSNEKKAERNIKEKMKTAVAVGMSAMAISGGVAGLESKKAYGSEIDKSKLELKQDQNEFSIKPDLIRKQVISRVSSAEYFNKLLVEFGGNEELAKKEQADRIENLRSVKIELKKEARDVMDEHDKLTKGNLYEEGKPIEGFYTNHENSHMIVSNQNPVTLYHELLHASTKSDSGVTENAQKILKKTYKNERFLGINADDQYYNRPSERLVRLEHFMAELDSLGIHKYGEEFTEEKYEQIMQLYKEGRFSRNAKEFLKRTEQNFQNFKDMFEKIAENEQSVKQV